MNQLLIFKFLLSGYTHIKYYICIWGNIKTINKISIKIEFEAPLIIGVLVHQLEDIIFWTHPSHESPLGWKWGCSIGLLIPGAEYLIEIRTCDLLSRWLLIPCQETNSTKSLSWWLRPQNMLYTLTVYFESLLISTPLLSSYWFLSKEKKRLLLIKCLKSKKLNMNI